MRKADGRHPSEARILLAEDNAINMKASVASGQVWGGAQLPCRSRRCTSGHVGSTCPPTSRPCSLSPLLSMQQPQQRHRRRCRCCCNPLGIKVCRLPARCVPPSPPPPQVALGILNRIGYKSVVTVENGVQVRQAAWGGGAAAFAEGGAVQHSPPPPGQPSPHLTRCAATLMYQDPPPAAHAWLPLQPLLWAPQAPRLRPMPTHRSHLHPPAPAYTHYRRHLRPRAPTHRAHLPPPAPPCLRLPPPPPALPPGAGGRPGAWRARRL